MNISINTDLFEQIKTHYISGRFDYITVTFHHLGCEILYLKKDKGYEYQYEADNDFNYSILKFINSKIEENCCLDLYSDEHGQFKIKLTLIIDHQFEHFENLNLDELIDKTVLDWLSNYHGKKIDIEEIYLLLEMQGSNKNNLQPDFFDFQIFYQTEEIDIKFESTIFDKRIKDIILKNTLNLIADKLGSYSTEYNFSFSINGENTMRLIEDCVIGNLIIE